MVTHDIVWVILRDAVTSHGYAVIVVIHSMGSA
jgi:hypothetical protein